LAISKNNIIQWFCVSRGNRSGCFAWNKKISSKLVSFRVCTKNSNEQKTWGVGYTQTGQPNILARLGYILQIQILTLFGRHISTHIWSGLQELNQLLKFVEQAYFCSNNSVIRMNSFFQNIGKFWLKYLLLSKY
jgi:hypothetical protein